MFKISEKLNACSFAEYLPAHYSVWQFLPKILGVHLHNLIVLVSFIYVHENF